MEKICEHLKAKGLKQTRHRLAILSLLKKAEHPLSADEIYLQLKNESINLSTVYRNLELLGDNDLILKLNLSGDSRTVYEYNSPVHRHYLVCLGCKKILPIEHCPLSGYEERLASETGYSIVGHKLDVYGYCPACQQKDKKPGF
ncbi:transcriptional repressor [Eubacteriaceae bacterium ES2]|nr:transcriptional repressor [Eubacteriaceae bacterium ES2]